jgi:hypothetical protein
MLAARRRETWWPDDLRPGKLQLPILLTSQQSPETAAGGEGLRANFFS